MKKVIFIIIILVAIAGLMYAGWYFFIRKAEGIVDSTTSSTTTPVDGTLCQTTDNKPGLFANGICIPQQAVSFSYNIGDYIVAIRDGVQLYNTYGDPISDKIKNRHEVLGCVDIIDATWVKFDANCGRGNLRLYFLVKKEDAIKWQA